MDEREFRELGGPQRQSIQHSDRKIWISVDSKKLN